MLTLLAALLADTGNAVPLVLAVGIFLVAALLADAVSIEVMLAGNGSYAQNLMAVSATGGLVLVGVNAVAVDNFGLAVLACSAALLAETSGPIPLMYAVLVFLVTANGALAVLHGMLTGNGLGGDNLVALCATGGVVCLRIVALAVDNFGLSVLALSAALGAETSGPIPLMLAVLVYFVAADNALAVLHGVSAGNGLSTLNLVALCATGGVVCIGIVALAVNDFGLFVSAVSLALGALAGGPIPLMLAVLVYFVSTSGALAVDNVMLAGDLLLAKGLTAALAELGVVCLRIGAETVNGLDLVVVLNIALGALAGNVVPSMVAFNILSCAADGASAANKGMSAGYGSSAQNLAALITLLSNVCAGLFTVADIDKSVFVETLAVADAASADVSTVGKPNMGVVCTNSCVHIDGNQACNQNKCQQQGKNLFHSCFLHLLFQILAR